MNPRLENWAVVYPKLDPYKAPEQYTSHLDGLVFNHPRFPHEQGKIVTTSPIVGKRGELIVTRSGTEYELGAPRAAYAEQYPNAKERLLASLKQV